MTAGQVIWLICGLVTLCVVIWGGYPRTKPLKVSEQKRAELAKESDGDR